MHLRFFSLLGALVLSLLADQDPAQIARIHVETIGGLERIETLKGLRADGITSIGDMTLDIQITALAPNRVRTTSFAKGQTISQIYDGEAPPWQLIEGPGRREVQILSGDAAREFVADAEFYDPLIRWKERGYELVYLGRDKDNDKEVEGLRVLRKGRGPDLELWLDARTYFIVKQVRLRKTTGGKEIPLTTYLSDFRPVGGVLLPHRFSVYSGSRRLHTTEFINVEANPVLPGDYFRRKGEDSPSSPTAAPQ